MAEGVIVQSVKISQGHLECSICCTRYNQPKNLECSHSFCLKCLQELKASQNPDNNKLTCPLCQKETILPLDEVTGLQNNYLLNALVEEVDKQEQLLQGEESKVICQACDEENAAISRCLDCEHYLCQECQKAHQRFPALKNHEIKTLAELQEVDESQTESKMNISRCDIHPIQELCLYCMTCEQLICKVCTSQHRAPLHIFVDLKYATDQSIQEIIEGVSQLDRSKSHLTSRLGFLFRRLNIMFNETKRQISEKAQNKISEIREMEKILMQEASEANGRKGKTLAKLMFAQKTLNTVVSSDKDFKQMEILKNRQKHLHDYINIDEGEAEELTYDMSFISFKESNEIGTLLLKESWGKRLKASVGGELIGAFSTGCLMVVSENEDEIFTIINPDGTVSHTYGYSWFRDDLQNPSSLAVNKDDHVIILDGPMVKTFGSNCQLLHQFTPGITSLKESDSEPTCLAVDENNLIAVGYKDDGDVSLHNPDGSLIRTLSAPGIDEYMAMNNQRIIYTSPNENTIKSVSLNEVKCEALFEFKDATPRGICCDKIGDIYVVYESKPKPDTNVSGALPVSGLVGKRVSSRPPVSLLGTAAQVQPSVFSPACAVPETYSLTFGSVHSTSSSRATPIPQAKLHYICHYRCTVPTIIARFNDIFHDITYTPRGHLALVGGTHTKLYQRT